MSVSCFQTKSSKIHSTIDGFGEYYVTPRISVRGMLAFASPGLSGRTEDHFRQMEAALLRRLQLGDGIVAPLRARSGRACTSSGCTSTTPTDPPGETRGGLNFGGGGEYLLNNESAIKTELRWDIVSHPTGLPDATGLTFTVGYKRYF